MADRPAQSPPPGAELLVSPEEVAGALDRLAAELQQHIDREPCILLGVMIGGLLPMAWLASRLAGDFQLDYCHVTRYRGSQRGGQPVWLRPPSLEQRGRHVIVIDDIFDEGVTLEYVREQCRDAGAAQVSAVALVEKRHGRAVARPPELVGLPVPDRYVFGCGMDLEHHWRHLRGIYAMQET